MRAFLYAGQGSQFAGMGKDLYEEFPVYRQTLDSIQSDLDILHCMHEGTIEELSCTEVTQPCMAAFAAGVTAVLEDLGIFPDCACGLSLGEYGALYAAGVFDMQTYADLVAFRGKAMQKAAAGIHSSMSALTGLTADEAEKACKEGSKEGFVCVVNYNCPGQYVICGTEEGVSRAAACAKEWYKARAVKLNTSGPFHTKYLKPAGDEMKDFFRDIPFNKPSIPVALNVTGKLYEESTDLKENLELQLQSPVRFEGDLRSLIEAGADDFIEIGPGTVLSGLLRKTARAVGAAVSVVSISSAADLKKLQSRKL